MKKYIIFFNNKFICPFGNNGIVETVGKNFHEIMDIAQEHVSKNSYLKMGFLIWDYPIKTPNIDGVEFYNVVAEKGVRII